MSRNLSSAAQQAIFDQETGEAFLILLEIDHPDLAAPIRVTSDAVDTIHDSNTYVPYIFDFKLPTDEEDSPPQAQVVIDNVSVDIANSLRQINSPASFVVTIVRGDDPSDIVAKFEDLELVKVDGDALQIQGDLQGESVVSEPFPGGDFVPSQFRGLFR